MKSTMLLVMVLVSVPSFAQDRPTTVAGDYFGQKPPGLTKELFAPGTISTDGVEGCMCFSHDGRFLVLRRHWREDTQVFISERKDGEWTQLAIAPFFMKPFRFGDFTFAPNESRLYFTSNRPLSGGDEPSASSDIWMVENIDGEWQRPVKIGAPISSPLHDSYPSVSGDRTIYFFRRYESGDGLSEILSAEFSDGGYNEPVNLGGNVNTEWDEWDPAISPDGSILIFCSTKPSGMGADDLYVSFKDQNGEWSESFNLGEAMNSSQSENRPFISADGKYLFFNSDANGNRDIYWIDMDAVRRLNPSRLSSRPSQRRVEGSPDE
ncbi:MAG: hypothetical protein GY906_29840 [bacterium]|nr:hypothetical protein [bacterium]